MKFVHESRAQRVCFGSGQAAQTLASEVAQLDAKRIMLIASERESALADRVAGTLPVALRYADVVEHVPIEVAERARSAASQHDIDLVISVGGGSTTGLAKAIALTTALPVIAVPTTYAGSEATPVWGLTEGAVKRTGIDPVVLPRSVVYDAELLVSLPVGLAVASGLNALAHCVDSLWAPKADPINATLAAEGARALNVGLAQVVADPAGLEGVEMALYGAYLAAAAFASAGSGLHHKICHSLGGGFNLPHAQTHATVLPYVLALNAPHAPEADRRLATAFGSESALAGLQSLRAKLDAPTALKDYGFKESDIPAAVEAILPIVPPSNPVKITPEVLTGLLHAAWAGDEPR
jgi:alcohol dehydrogenase class IV